jgi:uncharacterized protein
MPSSRDYKRFTNVTRATVIAEHATVADNFFTRFAGLLWSPPLRQGEGLLITPCNQIHMIGMKFAIDVIFFDKSWRVVSTLLNFAPGRISPSVRQAYCCLELPVGAIEASGTQVGDQILVESVQQSAHSN